jgi:hypothetical protein
VSSPDRIPDRPSGGGRERRLFLDNPLFIIPGLTLLGWFSSQNAQGRSSSRFGTDDEAIHAYQYPERRWIASRYVPRSRNNDHFR